MIIAILQKNKFMNSHTAILSIVFGFLLLNIFINSIYIHYSIIFISAICLISTKISSIIEIYWLKLSLILSKIFPNILLAVVYIFLLTPLSFLSKIFNAKTEFKTKNQTKSLFRNSDRYINKNSFNRGW